MRRAAPGFLLLLVTAASGCGTDSKKGNPTAPQVDAMVIDPGDGSSGCTAGVPVTGSLNPPGVPKLFLGDAPLTVTAVMYDDCNSQVTNPAGWAWYGSAPISLSSLDKISVKVAPVTVGTATLTYQASKADGSPLLRMSMNIAVESRTITRIAAVIPTNNFAPGEDQPVTITQYNSSGTALPGPAITASSSNSAVATVVVGSTTSAGVTNATVHGVSRGTANITFTNGSQSFVIGIDIGPPRSEPVSLTLTPASASVGAGQTVQLTAVAKNAYGDVLPVAYGSTAPSIASVNGSGLVTGLLAGTASIVAQTNGNGKTLSQSAAITVFPSVSIAGPNYLPANGSSTFDAGVTGCNGGCTYEWVIDAESWDGTQQQVLMGTGPSVTIEGYPGWSTTVLLELTVYSNGQSGFAIKNLRNFAYDPNFCIGCTPP